MRQKEGSIVVVLAMAVATATIFLGWTPEVSMGQSAPFKSYQLLVFCEDSQVASATFWYDVKQKSMGLKSICTGNCPGGTVTLDAALAGIPTEASAALRAMIEKHQGDAAAGKGRFLKCLPPPEETRPGTTDNTDARVESPAPESSVASAVQTSSSSDDVIITCPINVRSISVDWPNQPNGRYSAGGQGGAINFEYRSGSNEIQMKVKDVKQEGQTIVCSYSSITQSGGEPHVSYEYKIKRDITSCTKAGSGAMRCKVKP